jgi:tetratricopeptide (TPR) repeat protein
MSLHRRLIILLQEMSWIVLASSLTGQHLLLGTPQATKAPAPPTTQAPVQKFETLRAQATAAREKGQITEALRLYQALVNLRPDWTEGWWFLGVLNYDRSRFLPATAAFEQFVKLEPANGQGWGMLGICEAQLQKVEPALKHLHKAASLKYGGNPEMIRVGRYHEAVLLTRVKAFENALGLLGLFAVEHQRSDSVLDAMGMAILRRSEPLHTLPPPGRAMVREFGQAVFLEGEQNLDEAGQLYSQLETRYRGKPNVAFAYGIDLLLRHQYEEAGKYFKAELARDPNHLAALLQLASNGLTTGQVQEGMQYAKRATELAPGDGLGFYFLGRYHLRLNELPQAVAMLEKAAKLEPETPNIQYSLAQAYTRMNRPQEAARARAEYDRLETQFKRQSGMIFDPKQDSTSPPSDPGGGPK